MNDAWIVVDHDHESALLAFASEAEARAEYEARIASPDASYVTIAKIVATTLPEGHIFK